MTVDKLRGLLKKATEGTWEHLYVTGNRIGLEVVDGSREFTDADHALIVAAINALPELLAAVEERDRLKRDIHRLIAGGKGICPCGCLNAPF